MAASKVFSVLQLPKLIPSTCWNASHRNYAKDATLLKNMGYPEKPKRPVSAYLSFSLANRPAVIQQNPKMSFGEISAALARKWKELPVSEKQKYEAGFKKEIAEYKEKMEEYKNLLTDKQKMEIKGLKEGFIASKMENSFINDVKKREKLFNKPKSPVSPFFLYCSKNTGSIQNQSGVQKFKLLAEKWKNISESEREKYRAMFHKEHEQYKKDLLQWEEQMIQQGNLDLIRLKTIKKKLNKTN